MTDVAINTSELSLADLRRMVEVLEREEQNSLTQAGQEFFRTLVENNEVKASTKEGSTWHGFFAPKLEWTHVEEDGTVRHFSARVTVTDEDAVQRAKDAKKATEAAVKAEAAAQKELERMLAKRPQLAQQMARLAELEAQEAVEEAEAQKSA